jgi:N-acetylglucosamine-6-sulfatase
MGSGACCGKVSFSVSPAWEFYDLEKDPFEMKNVASNPEYRTIIEAMKVELKRTRAELNETDERYPHIQAIIEANWRSNRRKDLGVDRSGATG